MIPLALIFTLLSHLYQVVVASGRIATGQAIFHESLEARKSITAISRSEKFAKYIRVMARSVRVLTKSRFFKELNHRHHLARRHPDSRKKRKRKTR